MRWVDVKRGSLTVFLHVTSYADRHLRTILHLLLSQFYLKTAAVKCAMPRKNAII